MKTELSKISQDLDQGTITDQEARKLLLGLLGVSGRHLWLDPDLLKMLKKVTDELEFYAGNQIPIINESRNLIKS